MKAKIKIGIVGNPNSGKTCLFNALTGGNQKVGNWPGVTVEQKIGTFTHKGILVDVIDLPGIYSLSTNSFDEKIARDFILTDKPDLIVNIVDASHIERNLYLTTLLLEMKVPMIIALNMMDKVKQRGMKINVEQLATMLDCHVVETIANKSMGLSELKSIIHDMLTIKHISTANIYFPDEVEQAIKQITAAVYENQLPFGYDTRWTAMKLLEGDIRIDESEKYSLIKNIITAAKSTIKKILGEDADIVIAESRYGFIKSVCKRAVDKSDSIRKDISNAIDKIALSRFLGIPLFLLAMYFTFWITINVGGCFIDFFDILCRTIFVDGCAYLLDMLHAPDFLHVLCAYGVGKGIQIVSTFIPPIFFIFLCLSLLEDSGYMARAAFVVDRIMRAIGLPGKAFVPMMVGFGCNVPAILATRTLDNQRDRILTILINPFMSCGARLPVYALFATVFFPRSGSMIIFSLYLVGIVLAIITAFILKSTLLRGETSTFIMELPPYHIPTVKGILIHTWHRLKSFVVRAGQAIILVVVILSFLNSIGTDGTFGHQDSQQSVLSAIGKTIVPVFRPMGIQKDNWPAVVGIFSGMFFKEAVIATLDALYAQIGSSQQPVVVDEHTFDFRGGMQKAFSSIPENFSHLTLPFNVSEEVTSDMGNLIGEYDVKDTTLSSMRRYFDGKVGAYAYLLMILLYMPCVAALGAVFRELNIGWGVFSISYMTGVAWIVATLFYQVMRFTHHPKISTGWIIFCVSVLIGFIYVLSRWKAYKYSP